MRAAPKSHRSALVHRLSTSLTLAATLTAALVATGCGSESGNGTTEKLTVATWNLGLAYNFVPLAKERKDLAIEAAAAANADVLCIQEVWTEDDLAAMETAAKAAGFTEVWVEKTKEDAAALPAACTEGDTKDLQPCAEKNCLGDKNLADCVQTKCGKQLGAVSDTCLTCLASNLHLTLPEILDTCAKGGAKYTYGGLTGIMLLSRKPLKNKKHTVLDSTLVRRGVLRAEVDAPGGGTVQIACTHLTAGLSSVKYTGTYGGWDKEQAAQVDDLIGLMRKASEGASIIMGDLNTGVKKGATIVDEFPENYAKFTAAGYVDPHMDREGTLCTFCGDNTLVATGADKGGEGGVIDHVMIRGFAGTIGAVKRTHDAKVKLTTAEGEKESHLSDHFGISVVLEAKGN